MVGHPRKPPRSQGARDVEIPAVAGGEAVAGAAGHEYQPRCAACTSQTRIRFGLQKVSLLGLVPDIETDELLVLPLFQKDSPQPCQDDNVVTRPYIFSGLTVN